MAHSSAAAPASSRVATLALVLVVAALPLLPPPARAEVPIRGRRAEVIPGRYIVVYKKVVGRPARRTGILEQRQGFDARARFDDAIRGFTARLSSEQVLRLKTHPFVRFVSPDRPVHASVVTAPLQSGDSVPVGIRRSGAATTTSVRSASATNVAVLDTGIDLTHPDLNSVAGKNCLGSGAPQDDDGHGTHVAGTIGAANNGLGVTGIAPGTRLYSVKVLDSKGSGTWSTVICGIDWVTSTLTDGDPSNDVSVVNMSLSGLGTPVKDCATTTDALHRAICRATNAGATFVVAAGNSSWDFDYAPVPDVPAAYPQVLTVTAMTDTDGRSGGVGGSASCSSAQRDDYYASYSNFAATAGGEAHAIAAPGTCVRSTFLGGGYETYSGTSMATPHVAGALALCISDAGGAGPCAGLTPAQAIARLRADAADHAAAVPGSGFVGDPDRPVGAARYGRLLFAGEPAPVAQEVSPTVSSLSPADSSRGVALNVRPKVTFSEPMNKSSTQQAFSLRRAEDGVPMNGTFSWNGQTMTFKPSSALRAGTRYSATVSTSARNLDSVALDPAASWSFTTLYKGSATPADFGIETGSLSGGTVSSLRKDDGSFLQVASTTSGTRTAEWYGVFSQMPSDLLSLKVSFKGKTSAGCSHVLAIWSSAASGWTGIDSRSLGTKEIAVNKLVSGDLDDLVSGGEVRVRARCTSSSSSFTTRTDLLKLIYTYA